MTSNETIVDRVVARLKTQPLGDLITEEDLHDIVKEAIPKTFFEKRRKIEGSGYHERTVEVEPAIFEVMRDLLKESAKKAVDDWLIANAQIVADYWKEVCDKKLLEYVRAMEDVKATAAVQSALRPMLQRLDEERQQQGLPPLTTYW